jgi:peptidoglycan/xylan/chitin deacetylase (PgdA/CDA1 family)
VTTTVALTFDNLGEAAELQLGADPPDGAHFSVADVLPRLLEALAERDLHATFFVEGINAERYPGALRDIAAGGHEIGYHAWCHEQWGALDEGAKPDNLRRGAEAFEQLGLRPQGFRPPGGAIDDATEQALKDLGFRYCSPDGDEPSTTAAVARLPFRWPLVDAYWVLPQYGQNKGIGRFEDEVDKALSEGGYVPLVMHPFLWADEEVEHAVRRVLDRLAKTGARVARMGDLP